MKKLRVSSKLNLHKKPSGDIYEYMASGLKFMEKAGYDAADFPSEMLSPLGDDYMDTVYKIKQLNEQSKVKFEVAHLPYSLRISKEPDYIPTFDKQMHAAIDAVACLGVNYAVLHPNAITEPLSEYSEEKNLERVISHLSPYVDHAERVGLSVVVENMRVVHEKYPTHRFCQTPEELAMVADKLGIGVCWDFGHANISGVDQYKGLTYLGSRVKVLHINDNTAYDDDHIPPFSGNIDWRDAMKGLSEIGFTGLLNYEIATKRIPEGCREAFAKYLLKIANEFNTYLI